LDFLDIFVKVPVRNCWGTRPLGALLIDENRGTDMNEANTRFLRLDERS